MTPQQSSLLLAISRAIYQTVAETCTPHGTPVTPVVLALTEGRHGCSYESAMAIIDVMVDLGVLRRSGHLLWADTDVGARLGYSAR